MSKLQDLIDRLCPNGVEFKPLGEIAEIGTGSSDKKDADVNGDYPFFVRSKIVERHNSFEFDEEAVIIPGEGGIGEIFHYINGPYALHQRVYRIHFTSTAVKPRFAYYYLFAHFKGFIMKKAVSATVTSIRKPMIETFPLAIPPLAVQEEIVKILDRFADYAAELQAELQARKEQYEYYRNLLLTFNPSAYGSGTDDEQKDDITRWGGRSYKIQWKKMGEIGTLVTSRINADDVETYVGVENLLKDRAGCNPSAELPMGDSHIGFNCNDILIGNIRPYLKKIWIANRAGGTNGDVLTIRLTDSNLTPKFLYHILATDAFFFYHNQYAKGAKMPRGDKEMVMKYPIPIPPKELQEKIVAILDRFETLVNDLSKGLPAEIAAVKAQYEYYRNKLLTFKDVAG